MIVVFGERFNSAVHVGRAAYQMSLYEWQMAFSEQHLTLIYWIFNLIDRSIKINQTAAVQQG
ncbi:hypothetical protein [Marinobacterium sedimentorum]|uniref:hypothetical protein n=1 Tax=Marinobacterium sedimentorum TaxID=2927804 RepID=UPI0020C72BBE|nr:hypothetical protein [Marinobacterium sedimentorum]MCP8688541.1 hypothetical protein [Marinobacterium sedimentorum]